MKRISEYKKAAAKVDKLLKMADDLRLKAEQLETSIMDEEMDIPAVFVEPARNDNTTIYALGTYETFARMTVDRDVIAGLYWALVSDANPPEATDDDH